MKTTISLDRSLPVAPGVQLRGWVEYGIACGELLPGDRLPSIREMAARLGIAPMTVATVYRELQNADLIEAQPGFGTFVTRRALLNSDAQRGIRTLGNRSTAWLQDGAALGIGQATLLMMFNTRLAKANHGVAQPAPPRCRTGCTSSWWAYSKPRRITMPPRSPPACLPAIELRQRRWPCCAAARISAAAR